MRAVGERILVQDRVRRVDSIDHGRIAKKDSPQRRGDAVKRTKNTKQDYGRFAPNEETFVPLRVLRVFVVRPSSFLTP
jgi:hypothetical protein